MTDLMTAILTGAVVLARYTWSPFMSIGSLRRFVAVFETIKGMVLLMTCNLEIRNVV